MSLGDSLPPASVTARCASGYMLENPVYPALLVASERTFTSDNVTGAENQQERLIEFRGWVIGFVDGEGCFSVGFVRQHDRAGRRGYRTGYQVTHEFVVTQGERSLACLHELREFFGVGQVIINKRYDNHREHLHRYVVRRRRIFWRRSSRSSSGIRFGRRREKTSRSSCDVSSSSPAGHTNAGRSHRDRGDRSNDEPTETQARADQNPQRPYARHPGHRMKRWSPLHGDMQGRHPKEVTSVLRHVRIRLERNSLSGKFRPARMA